MRGNDPRVFNDKPSRPKERDKLLLVRRTEGEKNRTNGRIHNAEATPLHLDGAAKFLVLETKIVVLESKSTNLVLKFEIVE